MHHRHPLYITAVEAEFKRGLLDGDYDIDDLRALMANVKSVRNQPIVKLLNPGILPRDVFQTWFTRDGKIIVHAGKALWVNNERVGSLVETMYQDSNTLIQTVDTPSGRKVFQDGELAAGDKAEVFASEEGYVVATTDARGLTLRGWLRLGAGLGSTFSEAEVRGVLLNHGGFNAAAWLKPEERPSSYGTDVLVLLHGSNKDPVIVPEGHEPIAFSAEFMLTRKSDETFFVRPVHERCLKFRTTDPIKTSVHPDAKRLVDLGQVKDAEYRRVLAFRAPNGIALYSLGTDGYGYTTLPCIAIDDPVELGDRHFGVHVTNISGTDVAFVVYSATGDLVARHENFRYQRHQDGVIIQDFDDGQQALRLSADFSTLVPFPGLGKVKRVVSTARNGLVHVIEQTADGLMGRVYRLSLKDAGEDLVVQDIPVGAKLDLSRFGTCAYNGAPMLYGVASHEGKDRFVSSVKSLVYEADEISRVTIAKREGRPEERPELCVREGRNTYEVLVQRIE